MKILFVMTMVFVGLLSHPVLQNPNDAPHIMVPAGMLILAGRIDYVPDPTLPPCDPLTTPPLQCPINTYAIRSDGEERLSLAMEAFRQHDPDFYLGIMNFYALSLRERPKQ